MLAAYLSEAGYRVVTVDCFADGDTRRIAHDWCRVSGLALPEIERPVQALIRRHRLRYVVYGSGFERYPDSLSFLQGRLQVLGNSAEYFAAVQDKRLLFARLDALGIEHPPVAFAPPDDGEAWLSKPLVGEGGLGISRYRRGERATGEGFFWQRYIDGEPQSVLFLAAEKRAAVVGYQHQLAGIDDPPREFLFGGVISYPDVPASVQATVARWLTDLVGHFHLRGLNGLDFIVKNGRCYLLEINARPPASLQLYGKDAIDGHLGAVRSGVLRSVTRSSDWAAYLILYAEREISIGSGIDWPQWAADRPVAGTAIGQGEPICSIIARAKNRRQLTESLQRMRHEIEFTLQTGVYYHAIQSER